MNMRNLIFQLLVVGVSLTAFAGTASVTSIIPVTVKPGVKTAIYKESCITLPDSSSLGIPGALSKVKEGDLEVAYIELAKDRRDNVTFELNVGSVSSASTACTANTPVKIQINVEPSAEMPANSLQQAFVILMAAFALALMMESAFALLFNWRLFQEFFVGTVWRTPIMVFSAWWIVNAFDLDLLAKVFSAYSGVQVSGNWATQVLTAMIIGGGSIGVNKILVGLGFRSAVTKAEMDIERLDLHSDEAWVSFNLRGVKPNRNLAVAKYEYQDDSKKNVESIIAVVSERKSCRLLQLLFPARLRVPHSGGMRVKASPVSYLFLIRDLDTDVLYDVNGKKFSDLAKAPVVSFAPRAIVDFVVNIQK